MEVMSRGPQDWEKGDRVRYGTLKEVEDGTEENLTYRGTVLRWLRDDHVLVERTEWRGQNDWEQDSSIDAVHPWTLHKEVQPL